MLFRLAAGLASSALLVFLVAWSSPEWPKRREIWNRHREDLRGADGPPFALALAAFGLTIAVPAALGFVPGNILIVLAGLVVASPRPAGTPGGAVQKAEGGRADNEPPRAAPGTPVRIGEPWPWFVVISWSVLAPAVSAGTLDIRRAQGAQAVLGPAVVAGGPLISLILAAGLAAGIVSAAFWVRLPVPGHSSAAQSRQGAWVAWGRTALASAAISASFAGPSLAALSDGPLDYGALAKAATSFLVTCTLAVLLSRSRRRTLAGASRRLQMSTATVALAALAAAAVLR